jgi:hypothetical protein
VVGEALAALGLAEAETREVRPTVEDAFVSMVREEQSEQRSQAATC